jgi:hypothetical protein
LLILPASLMLGQVVVASGLISAMVSRRRAIDAEVGGRMAGKPIAATSSDSRRRHKLPNSSAASSIRRVFCHQSGRGSTRLRPYLLRKRCRQESARVCLKSRSDRRRTDSRGT